MYCPIHHIDGPCDLCHDMATLGPRSIKSRHGLASEWYDLNNETPYDTMDEGEEENVE